MRIKPSNDIGGLAGGGVLTATARGISDSQVTDGALTDMDEGRRWRDSVEKDDFVTLYQQNHRCVSTHRLPTCS